jgi:hypothetical protein
MKKNPSNKKSKIVKKKDSYEVIQLPSNNDEMEKYLDANRKEINSRMIDNISYAIKHRMTAVEIFSFKNSNFIVLMNRRDFKENLQNILDFSTKQDDYATCIKARKVIDKLNKLSYIFNCKKIKK